MAKGNLYKKLGITTIVAVYILIAVGGIVRSTGAGMGCPDWPKCFGQYIPPTDVSELPTNYKDIFAEKRKEKNARLVKYMQLFGKDELANKMANDPNMYVEQDFNATKTWIEYINRLIGALIGLFVLGTFVASFAYFRTKPVVFWLSLFAVLLTGFQAWIGSIVVSTNLLEGMITLHMFLAVLMVMILIYAVFKAHSDTLPNNTNFETTQLLQVLTLTAFALTFVQTILGTQVREAIDGVAMVLGESQRANWLETVGVKYFIHRSFSWAVLAANVGLLYVAWKKSNTSLLKKNTAILGVVTLVQVLSGVMMGYFAIPPYLQPIHLLLSVVMLGQQFFVFLALRNKSVFIETKQPLQQTVVT